jgi:hypothetical protein
MYRDYRNNIVGIPTKTFIRNSNILTTRELKPSYIAPSPLSTFIKTPSSQYYTSKMVSTMRDTHFSFGKYTPSHKTVSQETYSIKKPTEFSTISPQTKKTSVSLGSNKNIWQTSNRLSGKFYLVERVETPYKGSSVVMGYDSKKSMTTTQENFKKYPGVNINNLDPFVSDDIKKRHFTFGNTGVKYQPTNRTYGKYQGTRQRFDDKALGYLKNVHYKFGHDDIPMTSTSMSEYTQKKSSRSTPMNDLKVHSIVLGTFRNNWVTCKSMDSRSYLY